MKNLGGLSKLAKHVLLLLLVTSPLLVDGKRLPIGSHQLTEEDAFGEGAGHRSDEEDTETTTAEEVKKETRYDEEEGDDMYEVAMVARNVVHASDMVAINYLWSEHEYSTPEAKLFVAPMSDGHKNSGRGSPYFYGSRTKWGLGNVTKAGTKCTVFAWRSDTGSCDYARLPVNQNKCEHVVLVGSFEEISRSSAEYEYALADFFSRHETYVDSKSDHEHFLAKLVITGISVFYKAEEPIELPVEQYFDVVATVSSSAPDFGSAFAVKSLFSLTLIQKFFKIST